jgi:catechol 2,3-dioxygenase-like lactoylglutathione lyase family enzyme
VAVFASDDPASVATFWASLLGRQITEDVHGLLLVPSDTTQLGLRFASSAAQRTELNKMHVHLTSTSHAHQRSTVATALALGARHLDVGQRPEEGHIVLADPGGDAFCVIEAGNSYLAGCGFLGELACDGSRDVGVFWSAVLDWPLVWDQDEETAIQSPQGGTKVAWGGAAEQPGDAIQRQHLELIVVDADPGAELERLISLGATRQKGGEDGIVVLADPDGAEFRLVTE